MNKTLKITLISLVLTTSAATYLLLRQDVNRPLQSATYAAYTSNSVEALQSSRLQSDIRIHLPPGSDPAEQALADDGDLLRATVAGLKTNGDAKVAQQLLQSHIDRLSTQPPSATSAFETIDSLRMKADWAREQGDRAEYSKLIAQAWDLVIAEFNRSGKYPANALTIASYLRFDPNIQGGTEAKKKLAFEFLDLPQLKTSNQYLIEFLTSARMFAQSPEEFQRIQSFMQDPQVMALRDRISEHDRFIFDGYQAEMQLKNGNARAALEAVNTLLDHSIANVIPPQGAPSAPPLNQARNQLLALRIDSLRTLGETDRVIDERVELIKQLEHTAALVKVNPNLTDLTLDEIRTNITSNESMLQGSKNLGRPEVTVWVYERRLAANDFIDDNQRAIIQRHRDALVAQMSQPTSTRAP